MAGTVGHAQQYYDYFIVLDFEAQCVREKQLFPQEIIEFPALLVDAKTLETVSEFHHYVQPTVHTQLTGFCTELTGITQERIDGQPDLPAVLKLFNKWLHQHGLLENCESYDAYQTSANGQATPSFIMVTCGDWDLMTCLPAQAAYLGVQLPRYFSKVSKA